MLTAEDLAPKIADFLRDYTRGTLDIEQHSIDTSWFAAIACLEPLGDVSLRQQIDALFEHLRQITQHELQRCRARTNATIELAVSREQALADIYQDFETENKALRGWSALYHRYFTGQPLTAAVLADAAFRSESILNRAKKPMYQQLAQILLNASASLTAPLPVTPPLTQIPPVEYPNGFFGRETALRDLTDQLSDPLGAGMIGIEGMGGIGKTALTQEILRTLAENGQLTQPTIWIKVRARGPQWLTSLRQITAQDQATQNLTLVLAHLINHLGQRSWLGLPLDEQLVLVESALAAHARKPHIIVVDNLETETDAHLIPASLHPLAEAGAARLIITSRHALDFPFLARTPLRELSYNESKALINSELPAGRARITDSEMHVIYDEGVGGNPLALKLVAGQLSTGSALGDVLATIKNAQSANAQTMFNRIYQRIWDELFDGPAREVLYYFMLTTLSKGKDYASLKAEAPAALRMTPEAFERALNLIKNYKLFEISGTYENPVYQLHSLTIDFVRRQRLRPDTHDS